MSKSYQLRVIFLSLAVILIACESDSDKLQRLKGDQAIACINAEQYHREYEMVALQAPSPLKDSLLRQSSQYDTECQLATREVNRFMR